MSYRKFFWGIVLIFIGVLFMLKHAGILFFSWTTLLDLWPLLLIFWGISLLPIKGFVKLFISMAIIVLTLFIYKNYTSENLFDTNDEFGWYSDDDDDWDEHDWNHHESDDDENSQQSVLSEGLMNVTYEDVLCASLIFDGGAGDFNVSSKSSSEDLLFVKKIGEQSKYSLTSRLEDGCQKVNLKMKKGKFRNMRKNDVYMKLNPQPVWDMEFNIGAADLSLDLSKYIVKDLVINGGASSIDVKLGSRAKIVNVDISTGVSEIDIKLPEGVGARIEFDTVLSSKDLDDFEKRDGVYYSKNYDTAKKKIVIKIDAGISDIDIDFYS